MQPCVMSTRFQDAGSSSDKSRTSKRASQRHIHNRVKLCRSHKWRKPLVLNAKCRAASFVRFRIKPDTIRIRVEATWFSHSAQGRVVKIRPCEEAASHGNDSCTGTNSHFGTFVTKDPTLRTAPFVTTRSYYENAAPYRHDCSTSTN
jgi:hypothetical protein